MIKGKFVILAEGSLGIHSSKTANGMMRYRGDEVVAVIDSTKKGKNISEILNLQLEIPIVNSLQESLFYNPDHLLIGIAPFGGKLPAEWREIIKEAIENKLNIVSGLHTFISDDPEFKSLAQINNVKIYDLRKPPDDLVVAEWKWKNIKSNIILTVGNDCDIGKMTTAFEIFLSLKKLFPRTDFIGTGQTGILIGGKGVAVDAVISDFVAGVVEREIHRSAQHSDYILVEGQGSIFHQGFSGVTLGLIHGTMPDAMILCHEPLRQFNEYGYTLPDLKSSIILHEDLVK
ncbi:MAG: DUF1611 domain-containing protein, partial [Fidelibacterota bacterium]